MEKISIYQVLPRLYSNPAGKNVQNGTLSQNGCGKMNHFTDKVLRRIKDFGYSHIWYTGLLEHATQTDYSKHGIAPDHADVVKGKAGSPYAIKDYYDIDPDLAEDVPHRMVEFEKLLARTHAAGLKFVMDFVPNHVARQYHSDNRPAGTHDLGEDDDSTQAFSTSNNFYYITDEPLHLDKIVAHSTYAEQPAKATGNDRFDAWPDRNDWYETVKLNYGIDYINGGARQFGPTPNTWHKMTNILLYWAGKGVDAFRCDMAEMVPVEFWNYATRRVKEQFPHVCFIAEVYNPSEYRNYIHNGGFDYLYNKVGLYDTLRAIVCGHAPASDITHRWQEVDDIQDHMLNFLENHDEQRIASNYFCTDPIKALPALLVSALMNKNAIMIYAGQELGEPGMDSEGFSGCDGRTTIFDYWHVEKLSKLYKGKRYFTKAERELYDYYEKVITLCATDKAISNGNFFDLMYANYDHPESFNVHRHYAFLRKQGSETLLVVINFDGEPCEVSVRIPQHAFDHLGLPKGHKIGKDLLTGKTQTMLFYPEGLCPIALPGYGGVVIKL